MKYGPLCIVAVVLLACYPVVAAAWVKDGPVTPYGDYCPQCTKYGTCKTTMSHDEARKAMLDYYDRKGLSVEMEKNEGRFIRAKVKEKNKVIDVIIFDRRTGRIRSIY